MTLDIILLVIAALLALPIGLFVAMLISQPDTRRYGLLGGVIALVLTAIGVEYFVQAANVTIDAFSFFVGALLACVMGVAVGALVVDFLFNFQRDADVPISEP
jgi:hypothetical protein